MCGHSKSIQSELGDPLTKKTLSSSLIKFRNISRNLLSAVFHPISYTVHTDNLILLDLTPS